MYVKGRLKESYVILALVAVILIILVESWPERMRRAGNHTTV
jgi:hypothetical protein